MENYADIQMLPFVISVIYPKSIDYTHKGKDISDLLTSVLPQEYNTEDEREKIGIAISGYPALCTIIDTFGNKKKERQDALAKLPDDIREKYYKNRLKPRSMLNVIHTLEAFFPDQYLETKIETDKFLNAIKKEYDHYSFSEKLQLSEIIAVFAKKITLKIYNPCI